MRTRQAWAEFEEVRSWTCSTCDTMVEREGAHCRACAAYWADAAHFADLDFLEELDAIDAAFAAREQSEHSSPRQVEGEGSREAPISVRPQHGGGDQ